MGLSVASRLATYADARDARRKEIEDVCRTCENRPWSLTHYRTVPKASKATGSQ